VACGWTSRATFGDCEIEVFSTLKELRSFQALALDAEVTRNWPGVKDFSCGTLDRESIGTKFQHIAAIKVKVSPTVGSDVRWINRVNIEVDWFAPGAERTWSVYDVQLVIAGKVNVKAALVLTKIWSPNGAVIFL
jgi:hypothetical protein